MHTTRLQAVSTGRGLPARGWSNHEIITAHGLESSDEWIQSRTGITHRYLVSEGETTFTLAAKAGAQAIARAGIAPEQLAGIVVATCTPDLTFPSVAALLQAELGLPNQSFALDINAACSGFIHALAVAEGLMSSPLAQSERDYVLVIGAETFSHVVDWSDRASCVLFGDGAGAVLFKRCESQSNSRLLGYQLGVDGTLSTHLQSSHGVSRGQQAGVLVMHGPEVYRHAVRQMGDINQIQTLLEDSGLSLNDLDWLVPHQANLRILQAVGTSLGLPTDKIIVTLDRHANTSAASIPLALDVAVEDGKIRPGQLILLQAFGAGFVWSNALIRW
jgi:3-oxoacyl-[acyl-carrier-protein] synthase III